MKDNLLQVINDWKSKNNFSETKIIWDLKQSLKEKEYLLLIEVAAIVSFDKKSENIQISKYFQTLAQNDSSINSNGDAYRLQKLFEQIDLELSQKYEEAINKFIDNIDINKKETL